MHPPPDRPAPPPATGRSSPPLSVRRVLLWTYLALLTVAALLVVLTAGLIALLAGEPEECGLTMGPDAMSVCQAARETYSHPVPDWVFLTLAFLPLPAVVAAWVWQRRWWVVLIASAVVVAVLPLAGRLETLGS